MQWEDDNEQITDVLMKIVMSYCAGVCSNSFPLKRCSSFLCFLTPALRFWLFLSSVIPMVTSMKLSIAEISAWPRLLPVSVAVDCGSTLLSQRQSKALHPIYGTEKPRQSAALCRDLSMMAVFWLLDNRDKSVMPTHFWRLACGPLLFEKEHRGSHNICERSTRTVTVHSDRSSALCPFLRPNTLQELCFTLKPHNSHTFWNVS